jgi:hypothetical protein
VKDELRRRLVRRHARTGFHRITGIGGHPINLGNATDVTPMRRS